MKITETKTINLSDTEIQDAIIDYVSKQRNLKIKKNSLFTVTLFNEEYEGQRVSITASVEVIPAGSGG